MVWIPTLQRFALARETFHKREIDLSGREAAHGRGKTVLKIQSAIFAIRDHIESQAFLESHRLADRVIFDAAQLLLGDFSLIALGIGFLETRRAQQTADYIRPDFSQRARTSCHGILLFSFSTSEQFVDPFACTFFACFLARSFDGVS